MKITKERIRWIDVARGIAMLLVIAGHCTETPHDLKVWLYSFHMPLFFMISGFCFSRIEEHTQFKKFFVSKVKSLLCPYVCLSLILWF